MTVAGRVPAGRFRRAAAAGTPDGVSGPDISGPLQITDVRQSRHSGLVRAGGEIRAVVLEDGRRLLVDAERITRLGLEPGVTLAVSLLAELAAQDAYFRAREAAIRFLAARPRSVAEVRGRLRRDGAPPESAAAVLQDLIDAGYLDDLEFARTWVRSRVATRGCGLIRLRSELYQKGVAQPLIEQAIQEAHGEEDVAVAEERRARELAERRLRLSGRLPREIRIRRLAAYLQRRGFTTQTIARVLRTAERTSAGDTENA